MNNKIKVLILGASGFLGGHLYKDMRMDDSFEVMGTYNGNRDCDELKKIDVADKSEIGNIIKYFEPDVVLWSLMSKTSEKYLIELGLNNILECISSKQKLIFISSNAVFNGGQGNHKEEEEPQYKNSNDSIAIYANAKIDAEKIVKKLENYIIVRPGAIYGKDIQGKWDSRTTRFIEEAKENKEVIRTKNLYTTFVKVDELALAITELIKIDYKGIIHLGPEKKCSYYDYYRNIAMNLEIDENIVKSNLISYEDVKKYGRSLENSLNTEKCRELLGNIFTEVW